MATILVVDDDPISTELISHSLVQAGYETRVAMDGWQAWELLQKEPIDAIVTDEVMPGMSGQELCHNVRRAYPSMPVVMVSSVKSRLDQDRLWDELGVIAVLGKPFNPDQLISLMRTSILE